MWLIGAILLSYMVSVAFADWTISPDWTISADWGFSETDVYTLELVITNPQNITYSTTQVPVNLSTTGNDTTPAYSWNFQFANASWLYVTNRTDNNVYMSIMGNATGNFCCYVVGTNGAEDYAEVALTVTIILGADSYTFELEITAPTNQVYTSSGIPVSLSTSGNDTVSSYSWNIQKPDSSWLYAINQTANVATATASYNGTSTFCCYVAGQHLTEDYEEVEFMTYILIEDVPVTPVEEGFIGEPGPDIMPIVLLGAFVGVVGLGFAIKMRGR